MMLMVAIAAAIAPRFAPPIGRPVDYVMVETRPTRAADARITLHYRLDFEPAADAMLEARLVMREAEVAAPEALVPAMEAMFAPFRGVPTRIRIDRDGALGDVIGGQATWDAIVASEKAALDRTEADPAIPQRSKAMARAIVAGSIFDVSPAVRDQRLADSVSTFLPPPLPALEPGEARAFTTVVRAPLGSLPGTGSVTLESADQTHLIYRINSRTDPKAAATAVAALLATIPPDASESQRAEIEATAARLRGTSYIERTSLTLDRETGLIRQMHVERAALAADGASSRISESDLVLSSSQ